MKATISALVFAFVMVSAYNNCAGSGIDSVLNIGNVKGTEIGNPATPSSNASPTSGPTNAIPTTTIPMDVVSTGVVDAACGLLIRCNPQLTTAACDSQLLTDPNVPTALGLNKSAGFTNLQAAQLAEAQGTLKVNEVALSSCETQIMHLSCSSAQVSEAYSSSAPTSLSNVASVFSVPASASNGCSSLYATP